MTSLPPSGALGVMQALATRDLAVPPSLLGDDELRIPAETGDVAGCLSDDGTTLSLDLGWGIVVIELASWRQLATHRADAPAAENSGLPAQVCSFHTTDDHHLVLVAPDGARSRLHLPDRTTEDGAGLGLRLSPTRPDELYLWGLRSLTRRRCVDGVLRLEASLSREGRHDFGYEIRDVILGVDGARLYVRTDRDVLAVDAVTLRPEQVLLSIDDHFQNPRAWVDEVRCQAFSVSHDHLYVLLTPPKQNDQVPRLLELSLRGGVQRELPLARGLLLHAMSPLLPGERLLLGGSFHGTTLVDARAMTVIESARDVGCRFLWVDRARSRAYGFDLDRRFQAIDASQKLRATIHEGAIRRLDLAWNDAHLLALSRQRGVEQFSPPTALPTVLPRPRQISQFRLSARGRWALFLREGVLTIQDTAHGHTREARGMFRERGGVDEVVVTGGGVLWWWNRRELCSERGARVPLTRRESWGRLDLSPSGRRLLLTTSKEMHLLDTDSGALLGTIPAPRQASTEFANDQTLVVSGNDGVRWYDASNGTLLAWHKRRIPFPTGLAASPDGALVALFGHNAVELVSRDAPARKPSTTVVGQGLHSLAFSPDGASLAVTCQESRIRVFSVGALQDSATARPKAKRATRVKR